MLLCGQVFRPSPSARSTRFAAVYSPRTFPTQPNLMMSELYQQQLFESEELELQPLSRPGSRAKTSAKVGLEKASMEDAQAYFLKWHELFAKSVQGGFSLRTSRTLDIEDSTLSSKNLPPCGMTSAGSLTRLELVERHTLEPGCFLLPTPLASAGRRGLMFSWTGDFRMTPATELFMLRVFGRFPSAEFYEWMMGFPEGWTKLE